MVATKMGDEVELAIEEVAKKSRSHKRSSRKSKKSNLNGSFMLGEEPPFRWDEEGPISQSSFMSADDNAAAGDEEPDYRWNTPLAEQHIKEMKKLDKKLARFEEDTLKLKEMLRQADEKCEDQIAREEERAEAAIAEVREYERQSQHLEKDTQSASLQQNQVQAKLVANQQKIGELRLEQKKLEKEKKKLEKQLDKLKYNNIKLEENSSKLLDTYSDLFDSNVFDQNDLLDTLEENKEEHREMTDAVQAMHERYMIEAEQRLEIQKGLAQILTIIQSECTNGKLANECTQVALDVEEEYNRIMAELEIEQEAYDEASST
jgi:chromosome segregation ATPase